MVSAGAVASTRRDGYARDGGLLFLVQQHSWWSNQQHSWWSNTVTLHHKARAGACRLGPPTASARCGRVAAPAELPLPRRAPRSLPAPIQRATQTPVHLIAPKPPSGGPAMLLARAAARVGLPPARGRVRTLTVCQAGFLPNHKRRNPVPPADSAAALGAAPLSSGPAVSARVGPGAEQQHMTVLDVPSLTSGSKRTGHWLEDALVVDEAEQDYAQASIADITRSRTGVREVAPFYLPHARMHSWPRASASHRGTASGRRHTLAIRQAGAPRREHTLPQRACACPPALLARPAAALHPVNAQHAVAGRVWHWTAADCAGGGAV